jgi:DNA-binding beta-propeller fold protein YncE
MGWTMGSVDPVGNDTIGSLEWDGSNILAANVTNGSGSVNIINPNTGAQVGSITAPPGRGEGLAYDGAHIYYSTINFIHVIHRSDGALIRSFPPPGGPCRALAYGHGYLFSGKSSAGNITVFNPNTLVVRGNIPAPGGGNKRVEGLAFCRTTNHLVIANQSENTIYMLRVGF